MIWGIRLYKKGKKLVENDSDKGFTREAAKIADRENPLIDNHLCKLAKVPFIYYVNTSISSVVEFQKWGVLKSKNFGKESTYSKDIFLNPSMNKGLSKVPKSYF